MMEKILFKFLNNSTMLLTFLALIIFLGIVIMVLTRKLKHNKFNINIYGMLLGLNNREICGIACNFIRTFLVIYNSWIYADDIQFTFIIIAIASIMCILTNPRIEKIIFEIANSAAQLISVFLINSLMGYMVDVGQENYVVLIQILLSIFITIYTIYFLMKNFEEIVTKNYKRREKYEQERA